jgi:hypothetical protein
MLKQPEKIRPFNKLAPISLDNVEIKDFFWKNRQEINKEISLPLQLQKLEDDHHLHNFRIAAGLKEGIHLGDFYYDSDLYKWLEGVFYFSRFGLPVALEEKIEEIGKLIKQSQLSDGYLNTFYSTKFLSERFRNLLIFHELYCAGHLIEAALAQDQMTKDSTLLEVAKRFADLLVKRFLHNNLQDTCGHPEIEMALIRLYHYTGIKSYLELSKHLIDMRGNIPHFKTYILRNLLNAVRIFNKANKIKTNYLYENGDKTFSKEETAEFLEDFTIKDWLIFLKANFNGKLYQLDVPIREAYEPVGHAVRALYLYSGVADLYSETGDKSLLHALQLIWSRIKKARMFITGGVGSISSIEGFDKDFKMKSEDSYSETCAAIANIMWNWRMFLITGHGKYTSLIETLLYNAMLPGQSLDGKRYFYSNPLVSDGTERRKEWFKCPCCPTNYIRMIPILGHYIYAQSNVGVCVNQYIGSKAKVRFENNEEVTLTQKSQFPWEGKGIIQLSLENETSRKYSLYLRIPQWCRPSGNTVYLNGKKYQPPKSKSFQNYYKIRKLWKDGDKIEISFLMKPTVIEQDPRINNEGPKVALSYGPIIYCLEQCDNKEIDIFKASLAKNPDLKIINDSTLIKDMAIIKGKVSSGKTFKAIPYFAWGNREPDKMTVWFNSEKEIG